MAASLLTRTRDARRPACRARSAAARFAAAALPLVTFPWAAYAQTTALPNAAVSNAAVSNVTTPALVPMPRELAVRGAFGVSHGVAVTSGTDADDRFAAHELLESLRDRRVPIVTAQLSGAVVIRLLRRDTPEGREALRRGGLTFDSAMVTEGYALAAEAGIGGAGGRIDVVAASAAGLFYGAQTVKQLIEGDGPRARVLGIRVRDWPALRWRGVHDDLSRGGVPTLDFQKQEIRTLAAYKVNVYSPYFEHTLAYAANPLAAPPGGAMTRDDARELSAYARRYHVEIIPEQQAIGHLHHFLKWDRYAPVAEAPHGQVLAPGQAGTLPLVRGMFAEVDSSFPGRFLHVGADETFELGRGQTADRVKREGLGPVYLGFLHDIHDALAPLGRRLLFWGDIATATPALVPTLPKDMIAVAWWYDPEPTFDAYIAPFRAAGMETWIAPGVNNWSRVYPDYGRAFANIRGFIRDGQRLGARGVLTTLWNDDGEALHAQAWTGVLFGGAASWQSGDSDPERFLAAFARTFHGDTAGHVAAAERALRDAHELLRKAGVGDGTNYAFWVDPWTPEGQIQSAHVVPVAREVRLLAEEAIVRIARARAAGALREPEALDAIELGARRMDFLAMKFQFADDAARLYTRMYTASRDSAQSRALRWYDFADVSGINGRLQDLRDGFTQLGDLYAAAWRREHRPYWLGNVTARYDLSAQRWVDRIDRMEAARRQWSRTGRLPAPAEVGIVAAPAGAATISAEPDI